MPRIAVLSVAHIHSKDYCKRIAELTSDKRPYIIWDEDPDRGRRIAAEFSTMYTKDLHVALYDPLVDGYLICAENTRHMDLLRRALLDSKPVLCEKPLATTGAEAEEAMQLAKEYDSSLILGYFQPFFGQNRAVKKLLKEGAFGKVTHMNFRNGHDAAYGHWFDSSDLNWFTKPKLSGGGALLDLGTHAVHLLRHLGGRVTDVMAHIVNCSGTYSEVDDYGLILMKFASGVIGRVEAGWVFTGAGNAGLEIVGSEKSLWNEPGKGLVIGKYNNTEPVKPEKARPDRVERLLAAIEGKVSKKELLEDLRCSVDAVKIMEAAYASAASGTWKPVS